MTDKEKIILLLNEFANPEKMASFFINNATSDFLSLWKIAHALHT